MLFTHKKMRRARIFKDSLNQVFKHAPKLSEAMSGLVEAFKHCDDAGAMTKLPEFAKAIRARTAIGDTRVTRYLGAGGTDFALATEHGTALKIGDERLLRPFAHPAFDAPVLDHGQIDKNTFFYVQPIGDTANVTDEHVVNVIKNIRQSGFVEDDIWGPLGTTRTEQVALFGKESKPLLIDQGSAMPPYGYRYTHGKLIPDAQQLENLQAVQSFLKDQKLALIKQSVENPVNPMNFEFKTLTKELDDMELTESVRAHMKNIGARPALAPQWEYNEANHALTTLTLR
jgi:hypothetical protein